MAFKVLLVDDSSIIRRQVSRLLANHPDIIIVAEAENGKVALSKLESTDPDIVILDIEMPELDGIETLKEIRKINQRLPILMFSTLTQKGAATTLEAFANGASDYIPKPGSTDAATVSLDEVKQQLIDKITSLGFSYSAYRRKKNSNVRSIENSTSTYALRKSPLLQNIQIIAIGTSTGGPAALETLFKNLGTKITCPIAIVQHSPPVFTKLLADRLKKASGLNVIEATDGDTVKASHVYIAPGGFHLTIENAGDIFLTRLNQEPPENSCRPAVDVLFKSIAKAYRSNALGVIMTGMGKDGLSGCEQMCTAGASIIAQDEQSSVVWSMPSHVVKAGLASAVLPLEKLHSEIIERANSSVGKQNKKYL